MPDIYGNNEFRAQLGMHRTWEYCLFRGIPKALEGKILDSLEELKQLIPLVEEKNGADGFGEVFLIEKNYLKGYFPGFDKYARARIFRGEELKHKSDVIINGQHVAYGCPHCNKIIISAPEMNIAGAISGGLCGKVSLDYVCINCNKKMGERAIES